MTRHSPTKQSKEQRTDNCTRSEVVVNKRSAIRNTLKRLGMQATPGKVVKALEALSIEVSENFVARVKAQMYRHEAKAVREQAKRPPKTKIRKRPQQRKIPQERR